MIGQKESGELKSVVLKQRPRHTVEGEGLQHVRPLRQRPSSGTRPVIELQDSVEKQPPIQDS